MADETIFLQHWIFTQYIYPALLVFFLIFAVLEKTKLFGDGKKQVNAMISAVISLIFVVAIYPKMVVSNLMLFLAVSVAVIFVIMMLWGFVFTGEKGFAPEGWMKIGLAIVLGVAVIGAVIWATGWYKDIGDFIANKGVSQTIVANIAFVAVLAVALALVLQKGKGS